MSDSRDFGYRWGVSGAGARAAFPQVSDLFVPVAGAGGAGFEPAKEYSDG